MKRTLAITILAISWACTDVVAQNYTKDVDVTVELNPEIRAASRLDIAPALKSRKFDIAPLSFNGRAAATPVTAMITPLNAPGPMMNYNNPDYRGYFSAGYFYSEDFGITAGYRAITDPTTRLDLWTQFNHGTTGGNTLGIMRGSVPESITLVTNNWTIGGNFAKTTGAGTLTADASFFLSRFNYPQPMTSPEHQGLHRVKLNADWSGPSSNNTSFTYAISAGLDQAGFSHLMVPEAIVYSGAEKALSEISARVKAQGAYNFSSAVSLGVNVGYQYVATSGQHTFNPGASDITGIDNFNRGLLTAGAVFNFNTNRLKGHIGANFDAYSGHDAGNYVGFNGRIDWMPSGYFGLALTAKSGSYINTIGDMFELSRYALTMEGAGESHLDGDAELSMRIGSFYGFSFTASGGLCSTSSWLTPAIMDGLPRLIQQDLKSAYYGLRLDYEAGRYVTAFASLKGALSDEPDHAYYLWSDRASRVASAGVVCHPIQALTLGVDYEFRGGRKLCDYRFVDDGDLQYYTRTLINIGKNNHLNVTANYNFNHYLSAFARVTGIGQKKYHTIAGMPGSRLAGLFGVTLRF